MIGNAGIYGLFGCNSDGTYVYGFDFSNTLDHGKTFLFPAFAYNCLIPLALNCSSSRLVIDAIMSDRKADFAKAIESKPSNEF